MTGASAATAAKKTCTSANGYKITGANAALICQGLKDYAGTTQTFVAADSVGGGFDQNARAYAPYMAKFLGTTDNVVNIPAGNTVAGMNDVAATQYGATAGKVGGTAGATIGWMNVGPIVEDKVLNIPGVQFNAAGEDMLGGTAINLTATVDLSSSACAQWNSPANFINNSTASNVVTEPIQTAGSTTFNELMIDAVFGIHYKAISGYPSSSALLSGFERGDGCVITDPVSTLGPLIAGHQATGLIVNVAVPKNNEYYADFVGVPTYAQAEKLYSKRIVSKSQRVAVTALNTGGETQRILFTAAKTPKAEVAALTAAFKWASDNVNLQATLRSEGSPTGYTTPVVCKTGYLQYLSAIKRVPQYLTQALG
jgi:hypothetical protein